jgi:hypothetical protein
MKTRREFAAALLAALVWTGCAPAQQEPTPGLQPDPRGELPLLALWVDSHGMRAGDSRGPELRFAIWEDGRVLCAKDPEKGGMPLRAGTITLEQVALLKKQVNASGIFGLKRDGYIVPDAPVHCLLANADGKQKLLYWDERDTPNYGINVDPPPEAIAFKECWKQVKAAGLKRLKKDLPELPATESFSPPKSWKLK